MDSLGDGAFWEKGRGVRVSVQRPTPNVQAAMLKRMLWQDLVTWVESYG